MIRSFFQRLRLAPLVLFPAVAGFAACSSATDVGTSPALDVALGTSRLALDPGGTEATFIKAKRIGGLAGTIGFAVSGAPVGLTVTVAPTNVPDSSTLTVTAAAAVASGDYPITVTAMSDGAAARQAMLTVTVRASTGGVPEIESVAVGAHVCAVATDGAAYCWGYNADGQLGDNTTSLVTPTPVTVAGGLRFQTISVSKVEDVTCGLTTAGAAYCWGINSQGQLGDGTTTRRLVPTPVRGGLTFKSIAVGDAAVCAVTTSGIVYCWGTSPNGAMGGASPGPSLTPAVAVPGMTFDSVVAGSDFTCGLTPAGAAYCWGLGVFGQLGDGRATTSITPVAVAGGLTFRSLAAGGLAVCGLGTDGRAYCWGHNFYGTAGDGTSATEGGGVTRRPTPVAVLGGLEFSRLSAGFETMCGVTREGAGYCWGYNASGEVGDGTTTHRSMPVAVAGGLTFQSVSPGTGASCGVTTTNVVHCWGDNANGSLGDGTTISHVTPGPVRWP